MFSFFGSANSYWFKTSVLSPPRCLLLVLYPLKKRKRLAADEARGYTEINDAIYGKHFPIESFGNRLLNQITARSESWTHGMDH